MATIAKSPKKAQAGADVNLRRDQYRRLGRLAAKPDSDKVERVAKRMVERKTRIDRGKAFLKENLGKLVTPGRKMAKKGAKMTKKCKYGCK